MIRGHPDISGVVEVMGRLYLEIRGIEEPAGLLFGGGDFRPRIEYFHDAVRALTAQDARAFAPGGRLCVEMLAYDLTALRYLQSMPLASLHEGSRPRPPHRAVVEKSSAPLQPFVTPDRLAKIRLGELYQQYGVLFAALFKPYADHGFQERTEALNEEVRQLSTVLRLMESGAGRATVQDAIAHVDNPELRQLLFRLLENKDAQDTFPPAVKDAVRKADQSIAVLDAAHLQFATAQLALYEEGRDVVKKLAEHGMNLAGRFVENAMKQAARGQRSR